MKVELPEFKRCCFCIPLRYGLLAWGYIKLVISLLLTLFTTYYVALSIVISVNVPQMMMMPYTILGCILLLLIILDISMTIVFLVGGHKKTTKLLQIFNVYSMVVLGIFTLILILTTCFELYIAGHDSSQAPNGYLSFGFIILNKITDLVNIGIQVYVILLIRSEINKLRNNRKFRFINVANEAECALENGINDQCDGTNDNEIGNNDYKIGNNYHNNGTDDLKSGYYEHDIGTGALVEENFYESNKPNGGTFSYNKL